MVLLDLLIKLKEKTPEAIRKRTGYVLILPAIVSVGVMVAGLLYLFYLSFQTFHPFKFIVYEFTIENYLDAFFKPVYQTIMLRTLSISLAVSLTCLLLGIPYAYYIVRTDSPILQKILIILALAPFFIGEVVKAYGWLIILGREGVLSSITEALLGFKASFLYNPLSVYMGLLQVMLPFAILIMAPSVTAVSREVEMAAQNLGATPLQAFIKVVLPQLKPGVLGAFIVTFTISMTEYAIPDLLGGGGVDFMANQIYMTMFNAADYPLSAALSITLTVVVSLIVYMILKFGKVGNIFVRGVR